MTKWAKVQYNDFRAEVPMSEVSPDSLFLQTEIGQGETDKGRKILIGLSGGTIVIDAGCKDDLRRATVTLTALVSAALSWFDESEPVGRCTWEEVDD